MNIVQIASEAALIAKVGGLGDVVTGLSRELMSQNHQLLILLPRYGSIEYLRLTSTGKRESFQLTGAKGTTAAFVEFFLLDQSISVGLLDTEEGLWSKQNSIYGSSDELDSFILFSMLAKSWLEMTSRPFDVVHAHDWQAAPLVAWIKYTWQVNRPIPKCLLTIHNMEYQGKCGWEKLREVCGEWLDRCPYGLFEDPVDRCANLLRGGIASADMLTTVSETYAKEILTSEGGRGLEGLLRERKNELFGIVNGVDISYWNPATDPFLPQNYSARGGIEKIIEAKKEAKKKLFNELEIDMKFLEAPLLASVTRLVYQKGLELLYYLYSHLEEYGVSGIILGTSFDSKTTERFASLNSRVTNQGRGRVVLKSEESLAHRIYAAADLFAVPSIFEPCGLTQLLALHYGAIPIVRKTGGLADTIVEPSLHEKGTEQNGFLFEQACNEEAQSAVQRALHAYRHEPKKWHTMMIEGMKMDFGWKSPARQYLALYTRVLSS